MKINKLLAIFTCILISLISFTGSSVLASCGFFEWIDTGGLCTHTKRKQIFYAQSLRKTEIKEMVEEGRKFLIGNSCDVDDASEEQIEDFILLQRDSVYTAEDPCEVLDRIINEDIIVSTGFRGGFLIYKK